jgi:hypothetical protein
MHGDAKLPDLLQDAHRLPKARRVGIYDRCRAVYERPLPRVSRIRWLPRSATAPTRNCLDFGWRKPPPRDLGWCRPAVTRHLLNYPAPQVVLRLVVFEG